MILDSDRPPSATPDDLSRRTMITVYSANSDNRRSWWLFAFYVSFFTLTSPGFDSSEGSLSYRQAVIVLNTQRLSVDGEPDNINYFFGPDGHRYSAREFGGAVVQLPAAASNHLIAHASAGRFSREVVARAQNFVIALQAGVFMALAARFYFLILRLRYQATVGRAWLATLLLITATYCWTYSHSLFDGVLALPFVLGAFYYLLRFDETAETRHLVAAAALTGFGVTIRISILFAVVGLFAAFLVSAYQRAERPWRHALIAVVTLSPFALWMLWYNALRTGSPLVSPMQMYESQNGLTGDVLEGLIGLLISPGKGVFVYCPLLVLSALLLPRLARRDTVAVAFLVITCGLWLFVHARLKAWHGSAGWGPRQLVTIVPLLMLPFGAWVAGGAGPWIGRVVAGALAAAGFVLAVASVVINPHHQETLAWQEGSGSPDAFIWSPATAQSVDGLRGAWHNLGVVAGTVAPRQAAGASELNNYASNTVNVWPNTFVRAGVPLPAVVAASGVLLALCVLSARRSLRAEQP